MTKLSNGPPNEPSSIYIRGAAASKTPPLTHRTLPPSDSLAMLATMTSQSALHTIPHHMPAPSPVSPVNSVSSIDSDDTFQGPFASARIQNQICLVQCEFVLSPCSFHTDGSLTAGSSLPVSSSPSDLNVYRHEFGTLFRFSHHATFFPEDEVQILFPIDSTNVLFEEDSGVAFVSRDVMTVLNKYASGSKASRVSF